MRRMTFTLAALALVASCVTLGSTHAFAAHGNGHHATKANSNTKSSFTATTYTVSALVDGTYQHDYMLATNPFCSTALSGTGSTPADSSYYTTESITGSFSPTSVDYTATYNGPYNPGYSYSVSTTNVTQTGTNTYSFSGYITSTTVPVTGTVTINTQSFKNKGQYVRTLSDTQKAAFETACGTTTDDDQDTDSDTGTDSD